MNYVVPQKIVFLIVVLTQVQPVDQATLNQFCSITVAVATVWGVLESTIHDYYTSKKTALADDKENHPPNPLPNAKPKQKSNHKRKKSGKKKDKKKLHRNQQKKQRQCKKRNQLKNL